MLESKFWCALWLAAALAAPAHARQATQQPAQPSTPQPGQQGTVTVAELPFVMVLMPPAVLAGGATMQSGCWAKVYDRKGYAGDSLTLGGPVALAQMRDVFGLRWRDRVRSIEVGPKATVTVYDNANFRDQVAQFLPGQRYPDLSKRMGFFDAFGSIQLNCPPS